MGKGLLRRVGGALVVAITAGSFAVFGGAPTASAAVAPLTDVAALPNSFSADALPTVQIDGVVWSQAVVGNTVYAGGRFNNARPAGAAPGTNLTPRGNLLAYDITTGNLVTSFAPSLNGQVMSVAASPDGTRVYVVGDFTTANGQARRRVAAYSTATGQLITSFNPVGVNSQARAVVATNDTVYVGGGFIGAGGTARRNLAAFRASDGALLPWNPDADYTVWAITMSQDGSAVFAGGSFQNVGGLPAYGLAKINAATGALLPWNATNTVRSAGPDAGITSLRVQGDQVYGTAWHFGAGGNLEGAFRASVSTGDVAYVTDCHGDNYNSWAHNGVLYVLSHAHWCGNMMGHPQYPTWKFEHAQAWVDAPGGDILNDVYGYPNWHGVAQGPSKVAWNPDLAIGSFTGQYQAGWSMVGTGDYLAVGGEFPRVNQTGQQGLVRFARRAIAPKAQGPRFTDNVFSPTLVPTSPTSVRVSWLGGFDRDNLALQYQVFRGGTAAARYTTTAESSWYATPSLGFVDTGLTPGATYSYRVVARDSDGNTVNGGSVSVTMPASVPTNAYADQVRADGARIYWPLNDSAGATRVTDRAGVSDGTGITGVTFGEAGAITGDGAARIVDGARIPAAGSEAAPDTFSAQVWVKTTTTSGGRILGFGDQRDAGSGHRDRMIYMQNDGRLVFAIRGTDGSTRTVSGGKAYNDGQWHQITATMGPDGMALFVDGVRIGRRTDTTVGETYPGYWRVGTDDLGGWPSTPSTYGLNGVVDEVAIYPTALSQDTIINQLELSGRTSPIPPAPADAYGAAVYADNPDLYWRLGESSGTIAADSGRSLNDGNYRNGPALGQPGAVGATTAVAFDGNDDFVASQAMFSNPTIYSIEAWFKTTTGSGGKIIGFGCSDQGTSGCYDRHIYMRNDGRLDFGVWTGQTNIITTPQALNDGAWHHVVGMQGPTGMKLYVDGELMGTNPQAQAQDYAGFWRVGGDNTWNSSSPYLNGVIDEAAVYSTNLSLERVRAHYTAGGGVLNQPPTAAFTSSVDGRRVSFDAAGSSDPDGTVGSYSWNFGDGTGPATGAQVEHVFPATGGTFPVTVTVTDNKGATGTVTQDVTVASTPLPADAYGAAVVADGPRIFWRFDEASGTTAADAGGADATGTYRRGVTLGVGGALPGAARTAAQFDGADDHVSSDEQFNNPLVYSTEAWFNTTSTSGGKITGFGRAQDGSSSSYDRHVYMQDNGQLVFGAYTGQLNTVTSPGTYNDGAWHHVVATQGADGMKLYVDGVQVGGTNPNTGAEDYPGYWKVGGDNTWGSSSAYLNGRIDEVAIYEKVLSADRVAAHFAAAQPAPNVAPTATATASITDLELEVDGSASVDPDGTIVSYTWDFGDQTSTTGATATHTYGAAGTYTVTLTVTDDRGGVATDTEQVVARAPNQQPTAAFTNQVTDNAVALDASTSVDPDGTIETFAWDFGDGESGTGSSTTHAYDAAGTYTVTLTITDDRGATATTTADITVTDPPNVAPTAAMSFAATNLAVAFDGSGSTDPDGTIVSYAWAFGDSATDTGASPTHTYAAAGTYTVTLTVTDDRGGVGTATQDVTVFAANQSPIAQLVVTNQANLAIDVSAAGSSDPDGTIAGYSWDFGDDTPAVTTATASHTYAAGGTYVVALTVTDDRGGTATTSTSVTVAPAPNTPPTARITGSSTDLVASFDGSTSSDADGTVAGYSWDFGDGNTGTGPTVTNTYAAPGTYTVTLTVTDDRGATGTTTTSVTVTAPAVVARDAFGRTVATGWGSADVGGPWTVVGSTANLSVAGGVGRMRMNAGGGPGAYLNGVSATNVDARVAVGYDKPGTGGGTYASLVVRRIGTSDYRVKIRITATAITVHLVRTVNGVETTLTSNTLAGGAYTVGEVLNLRLQVEGTGTTTLRAKVWRSGAEPAAWTATATDTTAALQAPGSVGLYSYLSGSATNAPVTGTFDALEVAPL